MPSADHGRRASQPRWSIRLHADPIGQQAWFILCGLALLRASGEALVEFTDLGVPPETEMWLEVSDIESGVVRTICVDNQDTPTVVSPQRSAMADSLWKRSWTPGVGRPLGLIAGMRTADERIWSYTARAACLGARRGRWDDVRRVGSFVRRRPFPPLLSEYERPTMKQPLVLFQVRAWAPGETASEETGAAVNDGRAELISALKESFGARFRGGFLRNEYSERRYPGLITDEAQSSRDYVALIRSSAIGVSTVGLHGSNPWKLAEYLACGVAIVTEPLHFGVPEPLDDIVRWFDSPERCVASCEELLSDPDALREAQTRSNVHWSAYARPDSLLRTRLIEEFLSSSADNFDQR